MGQVISLDRYRARHHLLPAAIARLDGAVARLEPLVHRSPGRLLLDVERELLVIAGVVTAGRPQEAAERAERLADRLEHPAALA
jgi:hypothetical protein